MLARRTGRHSVDKALAVVNPLAFAEAAEGYITGLPADDLRTLVLRSIKRMDPAERAQFAMFLGHDAGESDDVFTGSSIPVNDLQRLVESSDALLPNRFAAFLRENPRAVPALGTDALENILTTLPQTKFEPRPEVEPQTGFRRIPLQTAAILALALLVAIVPLVAQYAHQRGIIAGLTDASFAPQLPQVHRVAAAPRTQVYARKQTASAPQHRRAAHTAPRHVVAARPHAVSSHRVHARKTIAQHHPVRVAALWKFDPRVNPYFNHHARPWHDVAVHTPRPQPQPMSPFEARARLAVQGYLHAVIAGDTAGALRHLGMPPGTDPKAISESGIVSPDARASIVGVKPGESGATAIQVDISGRRGEYFEVFQVAHDGPAVRITERYFIPVNRTAEEVSARLLARTIH